MHAEGEKVVVRLANVPGRVESFHGLLLITPARGVLIFTGFPATGHGALHVSGYNVPQGLPHLGVLCCRDPRVGWGEITTKKET